MKRRNVGDASEDTDLSDVDATAVNNQPTTTVSAFMNFSGKVLFTHVILQELAFI